VDLRRPAITKLTAITTTLLALALCTVIAFSLLAMQLRSSLLAANSPIGTADALVLLAGGTGERINAAARLYKSGIAPKILMTNDGVLTRWSRQQQRNLYNVEWAREELVRLGVPSEALVLLPFVKSGTVYDALVTRQYMATAGMTKIAIVTSGYHNGRALWTFRRVMGEGKAVISVVPLNSAPAGFIQELIEIIKFDYYLLRYGLFEPQLAYR
jgi:uncharacterized SAM-binding protein YcdF (DUF218 family)